MAIVSLPTVDAVISSSTASAGAIFTAFESYMWYALGITIGLAVLLWLFRKFGGATRKVFGGKRRGRGRRRR